MKKKSFISLIICIMLIFGGCIFTGCKKEEGYNISNLSTNFKAISYSNIKYNETYNKIDINYASFKDGNQQEYFVRLINDTTTPYSVLTKFGTLFDNSMTFSYAYLSNCDYARDVSIDLRNQIKSELDDLKKELGILDKNITTLAEVINFEITAEGSTTSVTCLDKFEVVLKSYSDVLQASFNFNNTLTKVYFNYCLKSAKKDYSKIDLLDFNTSEGVGNLNARIKEQIINLTQTYFEMNLKSEDIYLSLKNSNNAEFYEKYGYNTYLSDLNSINKTISAIDEDNKQKLLDANIKLYNIQVLLENENDMYKFASNSIDYLTVNSDLNATTVDIAKAQIISDHADLIALTNSVIADTLADLGV